jgi:hypothetical protein
MYKDRGKEEGDSIISLVKETADGLGHLIADHIRLARIELVSDFKNYAQHIGVVAAVIPFLFLGYALACVGLSVVLARWLGLAPAFLAVGGFHLVAGTVAVVLALRRLRRTRLMDDTVYQVGRSVSTITAQISSNGGDTGGSTVSRASQH